MSKMKERTLILIIIVISVFTSPLMAGSAVVPWSTEQYTATANSNIQTGPPLPITSTWSGSGIFQHNTASSNIASTSMSVSATSWDPDYLVWGIAEFSGTYAATADNPLFQFTYWGSSTSNEYDNYAWLKVTDSTTSMVLYDNSSLTRDGNTYTIGIPTTDGHLIDVIFGTKSLANGYYDATLVPITETQSSTLNYSTSVAPEPISSILFVTGGTLLAGRKLLKRGSGI